MSIAAQLILCIYLTAASVSDLKKKTIPLQLISAGVIPAILSSISVLVSDGGAAAVRMSLPGLIPGILTAITSYLTKGGIGYGDAAVILMMGCTLGIAPMMGILGMAFVLVGVFSGALLIAGKLTRRTRVPFVPFLTVSCMAGCIISAIG